jgi:glycosyltransferase involved in cell wall biosynthesis
MKHRLLDLFQHLRRFVHDVPRAPMRYEEWRSRLLSSGLIDTEWYTETYPDVSRCKSDPIDHFLQYGWLERRDPGPNFSTSGYNYACNGTVQPKHNPLIQYLQSGGRRGVSPLPCLRGNAKRNPTRRAVLVCAHLSNEEMFGAERSLLDVVRALRLGGLDIVVSVPGVGDAKYLASLCRHAVAVEIIPHRWWRHGRSACSSTVRNFRHLLEHHDISAVHLNSIVLLDQAEAARAYGLPVVVHARELPSSDPDLCDTLGAVHTQVRQHVLKLADYLIANSHAVARYFGVEDPTWIIGNCVDSHDLPQLWKRSAQRFRVGMISSNLPKKGLHDFVELARELDSTSHDVECVLVGPINHHVESLGSRNTLPSNLRISGYADSPAAALRQVDMVVNLSHAEESFGRTVAESMASGRPVACYAKGALKELVVHGETGYLVPPGDIMAIADCVRALSTSPELYRRFADSAREHARSAFGFERFADRLRCAYSTIFDDWSPPR